MNNDILALKEKLDKIKNLGWIECENKNKSVTGKTLENLLEINPDNFAEYSLFIGFKNSPYKTKLRIL